MSESQDGQKTPEADALVAVAQRVLSRRAVVRAGMVVVPVLMTLPVVPAWAQGVGGKKKTAGSTYSTLRCEQMVTKTTSCAAQVGSKQVINGGLIQNDQTDPFGASPFSGSALGESPFKKP